MYSNLRTEIANRND